MAFPADVERFLVALARDGRRAAYLTIGSRGELQAAGGALELYGLGALTPGADVVEHAYFLQGLLQAGEALDLPHVETPSGRYADVHLTPHAGGVIVVLLDAEQAVDVLSRMQQVGNDALRLARPDRAARLSRALAAFDLFPLEYHAGVLVPLSSLPRWWRALEGFESTGDEAIDPQCSPFLENFLVDARGFWESASPGRLDSGVFFERAGADDVPLRAYATSDVRGRRLLIVERLSSDFEREQAVYQRARETTLGLEALRREIQKKEVLLHCIVHDLRGPLSGVVGALSLLRARELDPERRTKLLSVALEQAQQQDQLIRSVLEVFAAEVEVFERFQTDVGEAPELTALARAAAAALQPAYEARAVELVTHLPDLPVIVVGREDRLERVLANLLENALRHAPAQTQVELHCERDAQVARVRIKDRGPGVAADVVPVLFERWSQGPRTRGAAGLGLYFCRITVEAWGGQIGYTVRAGGGACFWFELPLARVVE